MPTLHNVKITCCKGPKDDETKSFHVFVINPDNSDHPDLVDLSIYDRTRLVDYCNRPNVYDKNKYNELVEFAKSRINSHVDIDFIDYVIVAVRDVNVDRASDTTVAAVPAVPVHHRVM